MGTLISGRTAPFGRGSVSSGKLRCILSFRPAIGISMRLIGLLLVLMVAIGLSGCIGSLQSQQPPAKWTTGFWLWRGDSANAQSYGEAPDVLFVHAGTISYETYGRRSWHVSGELRNQL